MKLIWIIGIFFGVVSLVGAVLFFSEQESAFFSLPSQSQGEVALASHLPGSIHSIHTDKSEGSCKVNDDGITKVCVVSHYTEKRFSPEDEWKTVGELTTAEWLNGNYRITIGREWVELQPLVKYDGVSRTVADLNRDTGTRNVEVRASDRFHHKFAMNISQIDSRNNTRFNNIIFNVVVSNGTTITFNDTLKKIVINDKYQVNFNDLVDNHYVVNIVNETYILVGNLSSNIKNSTLFLDPVVELDYTDVQLDFDGVKSGFGGDGGFQMRWDITDVPVSATILNVTGEFFLPCSGICVNSAQDVINLTWIQNRTWALGDWGNLHRDNSTLEAWYGKGSESIGNHKWWLINLTTQFNVSYDFGYNNFSFRVVEDHARAEDADLFSDDADLIIVDFLLKTVFASSGNSNVSARPILTVYYAAEAIPPTVTLYWPKDQSNITAEYLLKSNFTCQVEDASTIDYTTLYSDFRNTTWFNETTNDTDGNGKFNNSWNYFFSNWTDGGTKFADPPHNLSTVTDRAFASNQTVWFITSQSDDTTRVLNQQGVNTSIWVSPDTTIVDIDVNETNVVYVDVISKKIWLTNLDGTGASSCTMAQTGSPFGIAFDDDNETVWVLMETGTETIYHVAVDDCLTIDSFKLTNGNPLQLTIHNNTAYYIDPFQSPDAILKITLDDGTNTTFITNMRNILGLDSDPVDGIWISYRELPEVERVYVGADSPNTIQSIYRALDSYPNIWNCRACDAFGNCGFADDNFTFGVTNDSGACWIYSEPKLFLPPGCVRQLVPGEVIII